MGSNRKKIKQGQKSLDEILKQIEPYLPKARKTQQEPPRVWKIVSNGTLPPLNSTVQD
jgi:hypothetical protein